MLISGSDTFIGLARWIKNGRESFEPDRNHFHQMLIDSGRKPGVALVIRLIGLITVSAFRMLLAYLCELLLR